MSPEARERSFDELARGLANGSISRAKALRLMGAALVGGALASIPRVALAQGTCTYSACCTCELMDKTHTVVRKKCFLLATSSCSERRQARLTDKCSARCVSYAQKYPRLSVAGTGSSCFPPNFGAESICQRSTESGVRGTECGITQCTPST